ncbi:MAG: sulfotransferase [Verrucomicrobiota bacterium]
MLVPRTIFIGGVSRSGTSLLSQLFDGHPQIMCFANEVQFLKMAPRLKKWRSDPEQFLWHMLGVPFDYERDEKLLPTVSIDPDKNLKLHGPWRAIVNHSPDPEADRMHLLSLIKQGADDRELFLSLAEIYAKHVSHSTGKFDRILEKTPGNEFHFQRYLKLFPKTSFIHLIRDPIDNLRSRVSRSGKIEAKKVSWLGVVNMMFEWKRSLVTGLKNYRLAPENYFLLRYEDLVSNPAPILEKLASRLEIEFDPILLKQTSEGGQLLMKNIGHEKIDRVAGEIDAKALETDSVQILGEELTASAAAVLGSSYNLAGYHKYDEHFRNRFSQLARRHPQETWKQWGMRMPLSVLYNNWRIRALWDPKALINY